jgi:hypothetical protein
VQSVEKPTNVSGGTFRLRRWGRLIRARHQRDLKLETICSSETSVLTINGPHDVTSQKIALHNHRCENLKPYEKQMCNGVLCTEMPQTMDSPEVRHHCEEPLQIHHAPDGHCALTPLQGTQRALRTSRLKPSRLRALASSVYSCARAASTRAPRLSNRSDKQESTITRRKWKQKYHVSSAGRNKEEEKGLTGNGRKANRTKVYTKAKQVDIFRKQIQNRKTRERYKWKSGNLY